MTRAKTIDGIPVFPNHNKTLCDGFIAGDKYYKYQTWIPVDEGYHILFNRDYYLSDFRIHKLKDLAIHCSFLDHVVFIMENYDPDNYVPVSKVEIIHKLLIDENHE